MAEYDGEFGGGQHAIQPIGAQAPGIEARFPGYRR
jgi:hypothetical protein